MNLHKLVIETAAKYPERVAVVGPEGPVSYDRLDQAANAMASRLVEFGVRHGDRIIIWDDKSAAAIAAMQAALRIGAVYVPVDGATPSGRVEMIALDSAARVVCTTRARIAQLPGDSSIAGRCLDLTIEPDRAAIPLAAPVAPDDLAYILYTSGSTGAPKGVCISHRNACAFVDWAVHMLDAGPDDRFANHASLTFDLSVLDLYAAFATGASVHLVPSALAYAPVQLTEFLYRHRITIWYSVPSALILMMRDGGLLGNPAPPELRAVLFAGEPFAISHVRDLSSWTGARLLNLYGPTETNVCTSHAVVPDDLVRDQPVPIGTAACGDSVWAEKPDGTVAGPGEEGELVVSGPTVMAGYWGGEPHRGSYRTGDVVRVLDAGLFDFVGRRDDLVKVRGHRIELGDVEATLAVHPGVAEVAVIVSGAGADARLEAFVVPRPGRGPGVLALKRHCAERLPRYMIADEFHFVPCLPRTRTGKTDRAELVEIHSGRVSAQENMGEKK